MVNLRSFLFLILWVLNFASSVRSRENDLRGLDEITISNMPHYDIKDVGVIEVPLPDIRGFDIPFGWIPIKEFVDATHQNKVYLIKNAHSYLFPNLSDSSNKTYVLHGDMNGKLPEIILWDCLSSVQRAKKIEVLEADQKAERHKRVIESNTRKELIKQNVLSVQADREIRAEEKRQRERNKPKRSNRDIENEMVQCQYMIDSVVDRIVNGDLHGFDIDQETRNKIRNDIMGFLMMEHQIGNLNWVEEIERKIAPDMWNYIGRDKPKSYNHKDVVQWLSDYMEGQIEEVGVRSGMLYSPYPEENDMDIIMSMQRSQQE